MMPAELPTGGLVTVFGGSGFVGRHVVAALVKRGFRVRVAVRRPDLAGFLQPLGFVGQIQAVQANLRFPVSVATAVAGADAVVNVVGIQRQTRRQRFDAVHVAGAVAVGEATAAAGIARLVHLSSLGAAADAPSLYHRSKAAGEAAVAAAFPDAVILRASVIFGPEDTFFNRMAGIARVLPVLPLVGADTAMQPVYVGDVGEAVARAIEAPATAGRRYELGGPEVLSFRAAMAVMLREIERRRPVVNLPFWLARPMAAVLQRLPGRVMTSDEVRQLRVPAVVAAAAVAEGRTLAGLGIAPRSITAIVPVYLTRFRVRGGFERQRGGA